MVVGRVQFLRGCWKEGLRPQPALAGGCRHALPPACHLPAWLHASSEPAKERVCCQGGSLRLLKSDRKSDRPCLCHALLVSSKSGVQATLKGRTLQGVTTKKRGSWDHPSRYPPHLLSRPAARRRLTPPWCRASWWGLPCVAWWLSRAWSLCGRVQWTACHMRCPRVAC